MNDRLKIIDHVVKDLNSLKLSPFPNHYAIDENVAFFESIKSVSSYLKWLITRAPKLDRAKLLELTDFPFPHWDREMHRKLVEMERKDFPGLVKPLVDNIVNLIISRNQNRFIGVGLGCGGMEVERQVIKKLIDLKYKKQVILIGIDKSPITHEVAKGNLREIEPDIDIHECEILNTEVLVNILKKENNRHVIIMCKNDIFQLQKYFDNKHFDLMYHSLFKHHLNDEQKNKIDLIINSLSKNAIEYDGFRSWSVIIPQTIVGWRHPVFLNAELFSNFRYFTKKELKEKHKLSEISFFNKLGTYLVF